MAEDATSSRAKDRNFQLIQTQLMKTTVLVVKLIDHLCSSDPGFRDTETISQLSAISDTECFVQGAFCVSVKSYTAQEYQAKMLILSPSHGGHPQLNNISHIFISGCSFVVKASLFLLRHL